jgi:hypothetical protein
MEPDEDDIGLDEGDCFLSDLVSGHLTPMPQASERLLKHSYSPAIYKKRAEQAIAKRAPTAANDGVQGKRVNFSKRERKPGVPSHIPTVFSSLTTKDQVQSTIDKMLSHNASASALVESLAASFKKSAILTKKRA